MKEVNCICCGTLFSCRRSTAKFCSNACKFEYHRKGSKFEQLVKAADKNLRDILGMIHDNDFWSTAANIERLDILYGRASVLTARSKARMKRL